MHRSTLSSFLTLFVLGCGGEVHMIGTGPVGAAAGDDAGGAAGAGAAGNPANGGGVNESTATVPSCTTDADCTGGLRCGYAVADRCTATGVCVASNCSNGSCINPGGACGCDGQSVDIVVMASTGTNSSQTLYTSAPYRGIGPCGGPSLAPLVSCNDGTGANNCCGPDVAGGAPCNEPDLQCWTACTQSYHGHYLCSDGAWIAGKGLFPCGDTDAGIAPVDDANAPLECAGYTVANSDVYAPGLEVAGAEGLVSITLLSANPAPPAQGGNTWTIQLRDKNAQPRTGATFTWQMSPWMPCMEHGSPVSPVVTEQGTDGTYQVDPVYLTMPGIWTITFDVHTSTGQEDKVVFQFNVTN